MNLTSQNQENPRAQRNGTVAGYARSALDRYIHRYKDTKMQRCTDAAARSLLVIIIPAGGEEDERNNLMRHAKF